MFFSTRLSLLLLLTPLAVASHRLAWPGGATFVLFCLPLAALAERLGYVTEQLAAYTSDAVGGLLNATFGNATEVIIAASAIRRRYLRLVKLTLLGSIASNLLLVLGCAFVAGGLVSGRATQRFNRQGAAVNVGLLTLASVAVALPTLLSKTRPAPALAGAGGGAGGGGGGDTGGGAGGGGAGGGADGLLAELWLSRFESVLMLGCYAMFLVFQLFTHRHLYEEEEEEEAGEAGGPGRAGRNGGGGGNGGGGDEEDDDDGRDDDEEAARLVARRRQEPSFSDFANGHDGEAPPSSSASAAKGAAEVEMGALQQGAEHERASLLAAASAAAGSGSSSGAPRPGPLSSAPAPLAAVVLADEDEPDMPLSSCLVFMALVTAAIAVLSDAVTAAVGAAATSLRIPLPFLATIVLPIIGNACEHASAVSFAARNRMEIALGVAVGSATQVAVLVVPFCVVLAWAMGAPLDLNFYSFEAFVLLASVALAAVVVQDGTGNWLKGALLLVSYLFVAGGFWVHRDQSLEEEGGVH